MRPSDVARTIEGMSYGHREAMYQTALSGRDQRRADEIALAPIPETWPEHERAVWRGRQAIIRKRREEHGR